jgi:hypothetical protein
MMVTGLQTASEGRTINTMVSGYMQNDLGWGWPKINGFIASFGFTLIFGGLTVKRMIVRLGMRRFTTVANFANVCNLLLFARVGPLRRLLSPDAGMFLGVLFAAFGARKRDAVESLVMSHGAEQGFGRGFLSGSLMNWRAVVNVFGPLAFGQAYAYGVKRKNPEFVFVAAAGTVVAAELVWRTLSVEELGLDESTA